MIPRRRTDEFAHLFGDPMGDGLRIGPRRSGAREDHHAGLDIVGRQSRLSKGAADDGPEPVFIDAIIRAQRRQGHRRHMESLARLRLTAQGPMFSRPAHFQPCEDDLRARGAHIQPHADQRDAFQGSGVVGQEILVMVMVELAFAMLMRGQRAEAMIP